MNNRSSGKLFEYEALRGLSIVLLLILHSEIIGISAFGISLNPFVKFMSAFLLGSFFFLAGYFTDASLERSQQKPFQFIKSRFIRIYPPYWAFFTFFAMLYTLKPFDMLIYLLNLQIVFSPVLIKPLLTLWYISLLVVFLILFFILISIFKRNTIGLVIASAVLFSLIYFVHLNTGLFDPRFFRYYIIFLGGICLWRFDEWWNKMLALPFVYKILAAVLSSLLYFWAQVSGFSDISGWLIVPIVVFVFSWVLLMLSVFRTKIGQWKIWMFLSTASYFAYLLHRPLWYFLDNVLRVEEWGSIYVFNFSVGTITALILGYYLQIGYDRLLAALHLK